MLKSPGAIAFEIGPIEVHWYGIIIALAFLIGISISVHIAKKANENPNHLLDLAIYLLISAIIGSRLYFVIFNWHYYSQHIEEILMTWQGGLSIHGALITGFVTTAIYTKIKKLSLLKYADILSYGMILGQAIGRWGNFFNSEAFGQPANFPLLYIPVDKRPFLYKEYEYFQPTFLYESVWNLFVFLILFFILRKKFKNHDGAIFFSYLTLYSFGRMIIESIRIDSIYSVFGLPLAQFISIIIIFTGISGLLFVTIHKKQAGHQ